MSLVQKLAENLQNAMIMVLSLDHQIEDDKEIVNLVELVKLKIIPELLVFVESKLVKWQLMVMIDAYYLLHLNFIPDLVDLVLEFNKCIVNRFHFHRVLRIISILTVELTPLFLVVDAFPTSACTLLQHPLVLDNTSVLPIYLACLPRGMTHCLVKLLVEPNQ